MATSGVDPVGTTISVYDRQGDEWIARRKPVNSPEAQALGAAAMAGPVLDLGCGPGWDLPSIGDGAVGLDASLTMCRRAKDANPNHPIVQARLEALPFADASIGATWASKSLVHLAASDVPIALAEIHRTLPVGAPVRLILFGLPLFESTEDAHAAPGEPAPLAIEHCPVNDDPFEGRTFSAFSRELLGDVIVGAGFDLDSIEQSADRELLIVRARRAHSLADTVAADMHLLVCGLNPSPASADSGVGFHRAGNRFWPAAIAAGLVTRDRDPRHALAVHHIGMTDIVKRTTRRADELSRDEFRAGMERLDRLVTWLKPAALCMVGLSGWRQAVDSKAERGWQPKPFGSTPVYVMPSTSGLNAHDTVDTLTNHFRQVVSGP